MNHQTRYDRRKTRQIVVGDVAIGGDAPVSVAQEHAASVMEAAQTRGLRLRARQQMGDWVALSMYRDVGASA